MNIMRLQLFNTSFFVTSTRTKASLLTYQNRNELRMKCKQYSESNSLLEHVLYALNSRELTTFACCKGHKKNGYIAFTAPKEKEDLVNELCTGLLKNFPVKVHIHEGRALFRGTSITISFPHGRRREVLKWMFDRIRNPREECSDYIRELLRLCSIQETIHDDLMYGLTLKKVGEGFLVETDPKFFYFSLKRNISLDQLESVCGFMDDFTHFSRNTIFTEESLAEELRKLNERIIRSSYFNFYDLVDYFPSKTIEEILWMMLELECYPGYLSGFVERNRKRRISSSEAMRINRFNLENGLYLTLLKLDESYFAKKEKSLQAKKYML